MIKAICKWFKEAGQIHTPTYYAREIRKLETQLHEDDKRFIEVLSMLSFK